MSQPLRTCREIIDHRDLLEACKGNGGLWRRGDTFYTQRLVGGHWEVYTVSFGAIAVLEQKGLLYREKNWVFRGDSYSPFVLRRDLL